MAGASAGLHAVAWLPERLDEARLIQLAAELGVRVEGVAQYRLGSDRRGGLLFGFGTLSSKDIEEGVRMVAEAAARSRGAGSWGDGSPDYSRGGW